MPLGVAATFDVQLRSVKLDRDAVIRFYTDGITEFKRDIESPETALRNAVARLVKDTTIQRPTVAVQRAVMGSEKPTDDAVLLVLQLSPSPATAALDGSELRKTWTFHSSDAYAAHASRYEIMGFIRRFLTSEEELARIELAIGEILANTVEHAPGLVNVEIDWRGTRPVVTILDNGPGLALFVPRLPEDKTRSGSTDAVSSS